MASIFLRQEIVSCTLSPLRGGLKKFDFSYRKADSVAEKSKSLRFFGRAWDGVPPASSIRKEEHDEIY